LFQSLEQLVEGSGVVDGSESVQIPCCSFVGELGSAVYVGSAPAQSTPGAGSFAVSLLASVDAEVIGVMDGGLGAQDAAFRSIGLVVKFHGVAIDAVLDAHSLGPAFEVTDDFSGEVLV
jgi:hypothetical protein